jgi:chitinase
LFLPPGNQVAPALQYQRNGKEFRTAMPPEFPFTAMAGEQQKFKIAIDVRLVESRSTYANPGGKKCSP